MRVDSARAEELGIYLELQQDCWNSRLHCSCDRLVVSSGMTHIAAATVVTQRVAKLPGHGARGVVGPALQGDVGEDQSRPKVVGDIQIGNASQPGGGAISSRMAQFLSGAPPLMCACRDEFGRTCLCVGTCLGFVAISSPKSSSSRADSTKSRPCLAQIRLVVCQSRQISVVFGPIRLNFDQR